MIVHNLNSIFFHNMQNTINNDKICKIYGKKTSYICAECNIHLHPECFTIYHNKYIYIYK